MSIRITGVGTLTRDAETRKTQKGAWVKFGLATKRKNTPEGMQDVDFFEANYFLKNPESKLLDYLKKGTSIYLDNAEMRADQYEKDGQKRTMNKIMIFSFDLLSTKGGKKQQPAAEQPLTPQIQAPTPQPSVEGSAMSAYGDEIPF